MVGFTGKDITIVVHSDWQSRCSFWQAVRMLRRKVKKESEEKETCTDRLLLGPSPCSRPKYRDLCVDPSLLLDLLSSFSMCFLLNASFHLLPAFFCMLLPPVLFSLLFSLPFLLFLQSLLS